jgi:membrane protein
MPVKVFSGFFKDEGFFLSAGIAWYAMFSLVPMVLIGVSLLGFLWPANEEAQLRTLEMAKLYLPISAVDYIKTNLHVISEDSGKVGVFGVLTLLWSGRVLFRALELSLNRAWGITAKRSFLMGNLLSMMLVLLCAAITFFVSGVSAFLSYVEVVLAKIKLPIAFGFSMDETRFWAGVHSWLVTPIAVTLIYLVLYVMLPCRQVPIRVAVPGALFAAGLTRLTSFLYVTYVLQMMSLNPVYASIGSVAGLMIWLYLSAIIFVLGCEVMSVMLEDTTFRPGVKAPAKATRKIKAKTETKKIEAPV